MHLLQDALAKLKHLESRFHELVNPEEAIREASVAVVKHAGEALVEFGQKLEALGARVEKIAAHPALSVPPLDDTVPPATEPSADAQDTAPAAAVPQDAKPAAEEPKA